MLRAELEEINHLGQHEAKPDKLQQRESELGHNSEMITKLFGQVKGAKPTVDGLNKIVDRLQVKSKTHDMAAQIMLNLERLETQQ